MKIRMMKLMTLTLCLTLAAGAFLNPRGALADQADYYSLNGYQACIAGMTRNQILIWDDMMIDYNFPKSVLRNVIAKCQSERGTPVNLLGMVPTKGSNLRSYTSYGNNRNIVMKIHGNETVYVYYSLYDSNGGLWYYAVTRSGMEGYLAAVRIMLDYNWGVTY